MIGSIGSVGQTDLSRQGESVIGITGYGRYPPHSLHLHMNAVVLKLPSRILRTLPLVSVGWDRRRRLH